MNKFVFLSRLEQEIEELETGVPANKGVAKENGGEFHIHGNVSPGRLPGQQPERLCQKEKAGS